MDRKLRLRFQSLRFFLISSSKRHLLSHVTIHLDPFFFPRSLFLTISPKPQLGGQKEKSVQEWASNSK
jgi:hypothetical protein